MSNGFRETLINDLISHLTANHIPYKLSRPKNGTTLKIKNEVLVKVLTIANMWGSDGIVLPKIINDGDLSKVGGKRFKRWCGTYVVKANYSSVYDILVDYASILNSRYAKKRIRKKRSRTIIGTNATLKIGSPKPGQRTEDGKGIYLKALERVKAGNLLAYSPADLYGVQKYNSNIHTREKIAGVAQENGENGEIIELSFSGKTIKAESIDRIKRIKKRRMPKKKKI